MAKKTDSTTGLTFDEAFDAYRRAGDKVFSWNGKDYSTKMATSPNRANKVGQAIALPQDEERGRTRGRRADAPSYSNEGRSGRSSYQEPMPQDAEAGMSRGTRRDGGAGRGWKGGPDIEDIVNGPATYDAGAGRGTQGTAAEYLKRGGSVKNYKPKTKRYDYGGDVTASVDPAESEAKQRGLAESNKEAPVGFFERLRMGNIDDPNSEAYKRFGAGRGRSMVPVEDRTPTPVKSDIDTANASKDPIGSLNESRGWTDTDKSSASETKPSKMEVAKPAAATPTPKPAAAKPTPKPAAKSDSGKDGRGVTDMSAYKPRRDYTNESERGRASGSEATPARKLTREELVALIPTGGSGSSGGSGSRPTEREDNFFSDSELGRNVYNTMMALPGLGGFARAGTMGAARLFGGVGSKAAQTAAKEAKPIATAAEKATESVAKKSGRDFSKIVKDKEGTAQGRKATASKQPDNKAEVTDAGYWGAKRGGSVKFASGGFVARRGDGIAKRGKTKGVMR